jgi:pimeloyl-ACP methyl ester carboxylesterase
MLLRLLTLALAGFALSADAAPSSLRPDGSAVHYRNVEADGQQIFYREAGPAGAPTVLLLHGFPTSSQMFRNLIPALATKYHVVAPDYPGFGFSSMPSRADYKYSFANLAKTVDAFAEKLGLTRYALYVMDYGAPVGYRLAIAHPERVTALIVQNGNAYEEGLREFWIPVKKYWAEPNAANRDGLRGLVKFEATKWQYTTGVSDTSLLDPGAWTLDQLGLDRPGNDEIQLDLFLDYGTNVPLYPKFQAFFREKQPPTLIVWGKNDPIFPAEGAAPYKRDLPKAEIHLLDTGHFALETHGAEIAERILKFLKK